MVYEEYLTEKLEEVKMLLREKTERLEEEGFRFHYDAFWETNENGKNGFIQITVSLNGKEEEQLSYYHCLCENVGRDEKCHSLEPFIENLLYDFAQIEQRGRKAFKSLYREQLSKGMEMAYGKLFGFFARVRIIKTVLLFCLLGLVGFGLLYLIFF